MKNKKYSSYILFCIEQRPVLKNYFPSMNSREITKELGKKWNSLSPEEKLAYKKKSEKRIDIKEKDDEPSFLLCFFFYVYYVITLSTVCFMFSNDSYNDPLSYLHLDRMLPNPYDNVYPIPLPQPITYDLFLWGSSFFNFIRRFL